MNYTFIKAITLAKKTLKPVPLYGIYYVNITSGFKIQKVKTINPRLQYLNDTKQMLIHTSIMDEYGISHHLTGTLSTNLKR